MKSITIIVYLVLNCIPLSAQTNRFYYHVSFKHDSLSLDYIKESVVLDITKDKMKFYPEDDLQKDSIRITSGNYQYSHTKFRHKLSRDKNTNIHLNYISLSPNYYVFETEDDQQWKITNETKESEGIKLQKALTDYGGRQWEAWFAPSIPFQVGPYKFKGLPGLIVELRDSKDQYIFMLYKSKNLPTEYDTSYFLENLNKKKALKITEKSYQKLKLDLFKNPLKDFGKEGIMVINKQGEQVHINNRELSIRQQKHLRKYNNPNRIG